MMVLAYKRGFAAPPADGIAELGVCLLTANDALDISYPSMRDRRAKLPFAQELLANYGQGRFWEDRSRSRALDIARKVIAGDIGTIEACRTLASAQHRIGNGLEDVFRTFAAIDGEMVALPIGAVRAEWDPNALMQQDVRIAIAEEQYRGQAVEACRRLIERYGAPD